MSKNSPQSNIILGIDVGGTFTDIVAVDLNTGTALSDKILTSYPDPSDNILNGIKKMMDRGLQLAAVTQVVHGTTLVINTLIERKGASAALITTKGFKDIITIGREMRYDIYDLNITYPAPLIKRHRILEAHERIDFKGEVVAELDREQLATDLEALAATDVEAVAVSLLHAYANPSHEQQVAGMVKEYLPEVEISLSSQVLPQIKEYERSVATLTNAYVQPITKRYLQNLEERLIATGFRGDFFVLSSSGGALTRSVADKYPIRILESGPAAGTLAAQHFGAQSGHKRIFSFDMGGTTAKSCIILDEKPTLTTEYEVARVRRFIKGSGLPINLPTVDLIEIGAGGGSIAHINEMSLLQVGPMSAQAYPGPVCYNQGGERPTVTDANLVLGYYNPDYFLGGEMALNKSAAEDAIERHVASKLRINTVEAAWGILEIVNQNMADSARVHSVEKNVDIRNFTMVAFGGAGPSHAFHIARVLGISTILIPPRAGVISAIGLLLAPKSFDASISFVTPLEELKPDGVDRIFSDLEETVRAAHKSYAKAMKLNRSVDMCYQGQGSELNIPLEEDLRDSTQLELLKRRFESTYERRFSRRLTNTPVVCVTWRVSTEEKPRIVDICQDMEPIDRDNSVKERREVYYSGSWLDCGVYERGRLLPGDEINGPAVIEDVASTIFVGPEADFRMDDQNSIIINLFGGK
jgi:N-methylhydantoinase A/oxoprolinase/acetone carboxylase beta subunit